ncbi:MAG: glycosyltransferase family 1 protein [Candidatus Microsaccharimonas sossegonensis]|uniref:Glycosyltransferase family 1 protein n=1 Tax=Candidatus Microsaccharimonas sossegonensis TaxID=2506948 RepID=A0A4Q0AHC0_9BACT|nr:MAG: glycosyltransferase family 1 protein [Candidatus Microsaccharimonas sossegonensis]
MAHIAIDARIINSTTGRYVERLLTYLQEIDHTNVYSVLVRAKDENFWKPTAHNFMIKIAEFDNYSIAEQTGFYRFLKKLNPDLVHFAMPQQPVLFKGKKVTTFHDFTLIKTYNSDKNWFVFHAKQQIGKSVFKKVATESNHIITPSKFTKEELLNFIAIDEEKITVIYESTDVQQGASKTYKLPYKKYLLYVGQQSDYKNIKRLGDAHQKILQMYPDLALVLVGKKNASALANEAYFAKNEYKNILFTDFVEDAQLNWLYTHATAYVFPSLMEGFGLPGLEAMGHGIPVISSNATCLPEIYGKAAYYFEPTNTDDIARAIIEVLGNEKLRQKLSINGYQQIKKYSWKKMAEQTLKIYENVLKS